MIPIAIVAHSSREKRVERLAQAIQAEFVTLDNGSRGPGNNHLVAWEWLAENKGLWSVVLEDDAVPVQGFREQLAAVLAVAPDPVVSLYLGRGRPRQYQPAISQVITRPEHFIRAPELLHHVGVAIRTSYLNSMLIALSHQDLRRVPVDEAIGQWVRARNMLVSYCHPSIVDHDLTLPTTIREHTSTHATETGTRNDPREVRRAWQFGPRSQWSGTHTKMPPAVL